MNVFLYGLWLLKLAMAAASSRAERMLVGFLTQVQVSQLLRSLEKEQIPALTLTTLPYILLVYFYVR